MLKRKKGQSTLEYAMVIAVIVAALVAMQIYMKRSVQGKLRSATDDIGQQYSVGNMTGTVTTQAGTVVSTEKSGGALGRGVSKYEITSATGTTKGGAESVSADIVTDETQLFYP